MGAAEMIEEGGGKGGGGDDSIARATSVILVHATERAAPKKRQQYRCGGTHYSGVIFFHQGLLGQAGAARLRKLHIFFCGKPALPASVSRTKKSALKLAPEDCDRVKDEKRMTVAII